MYSEIMGAAVSDPSTPQSSKSRRFRGKQPPTIDIGATRVAEDVPVTADPIPETVLEENMRSESETSQEKAVPPEAMAESAPTQQKSAGNSGRAAVTGLIFGLIGGVAGAGLMQFVVSPTASPPAQQDAQFKALDARLASVETASREALQKVADTNAAQQALRQTIQAAASRIEALTQQQQASPVSAASTDVTAQLDQRIAALDGAAQAAAASAKSQLDNVQRSLATVSGRFDALEKQVASVARPAADPMPAIRYVLAQRLDQAVATGKPFEPAFKAMRESGISAADLADLAAFAAVGAPTAAQLKADFKEPAEVMIAQERGQSGETFTDKLSRMSKSVLRIRPQGTADGTDVASLVVRVEASLDRNAFADAAALWNSLPDAMKQLSAPWGKRINDRAKAANALTTLSASAVTGLEAAAR